MEQNRFFSSRDKQYSQLIFENVVKENPWKKGSIFYAMYYDAEYGEEPYVTKKDTD